MPSPSARATFLESLPTELQARVLACLSTKERAALPLVCKAFERLANAPGSLLWETLDLRVTPQDKEAALQSRTRRLLSARGERTKALSIGFGPGLLRECRSVFATALPPLCPQLQELVMAGSPSRLRASHARFIARACRNLKVLDVGLLDDEFDEALAGVCRSTGLKWLRVRSDVLSGGVESPVNLQPLQALTQLRRLELCLEMGDVRVPACLPSRLLQLEHLRLEGYAVNLPANFGELQRLTAVCLLACFSWEHMWSAVSGLPALKELSLLLATREAVPPVLHPAAFSSSLTGLTCTLLRDSDEPLQGDTVAGSLLALPALRSLALHNVGLAPSLDWNSLGSLRGLTCVGHGQDFLHIRTRVHLLGGLTCLAINEGRDVTDEAAAELLCQLKSLRRLELEDTKITRLPELSSAQHTALVLRANAELSFGPESLLVLDAMSSLRSLCVCLCGLDRDAPAGDPESCAFLCAISKGLDACSHCNCHCGG